MDQGARHWLLRTAKLNLWRVATFYDLADLIQDGCLIWYKVVNHYEVKPNRQRLRPHLMALFKRSYMNHLHDLANERTALEEALVSDLILRSAETSEYDIWDRYVRAPEDGLSHSQLLAEMEPVAKQALIMLESDAGAEMMRRPYRRRLDGTRETTDERVSSLIGVKDGAMIALENALRGAPVCIGEG